MIGIVVLKYSRYEFRLSISSACSAVFSCTSNGILRKASCNTGSDSGLQTVVSTSLPSRLCDWRMSDNRETFAYGGDEVDLSVWSTELAWQSQSESSTLPGSSSKKRKRGDDLFPAEIWRARNVSYYLKTLLHGILLTHRNRFPMITWAFGNQFASHR